MEEALMLSRICSSVKLLHRRSTFRASLVLQQRVLANPNIEVIWNSAVKRFIGTNVTEPKEGELPEMPVLHSVELVNTKTSDAKTTFLNLDAAFVAIGHDPNTQVLKGQVEMDQSNYIVTLPRSTRTSVPGVFAAGDVADHIYRQAVTSAGSGAMAALDAERYLSENPVEEDQCVKQEDFSSWSLKDLRTHVNLLGIKCVACTEKSDFIASLKATY